jgi:hypothetical protein
LGLIGVLRKIDAELVSEPFDRALRITEQRSLGLEQVFDFLFRLALPII